MKKIFISLIIFIFLTSFLSNSIAQDNNNPEKENVKKGKKKCFKRMKAYFRYRDNDFNGALRIYREIYENNKTDAKINFFIGKCNTQLQNMDEALLYLQSAKNLDANVDKKLHFYIGEAYQYLGKLDSAIIEYNIYKSLLSSGQLKKDVVSDFLEQTETAKRMIETPVNVKIKNSGLEINSEFDDALPSITADGKVLIFTSRRPDTKGGRTDPNTGQYYDDIYMSTWNNDKGKWESAIGVEGELNTNGHDACLSISPDGSTIFIYRNIPKVTGSGDIYYSTKRPDGKWSNPKTIGKPVNSSYFESSACISPDGNINQCQLSEKSIIKIFPDKKEMIKNMTKEKTFTDKEAIVIEILKHF